MYLDSLYQIYIDYCFNNCTQLIKEYRLKGRANEWGFPHFCLSTFVRSGEKLTRYRFQRSERAYLKDALAYLEVHGTSLWQDYKDDPEYKKEIGKSYLWIHYCKLEGHRYPPRNYFELGLVFSAMECFMMLEDKKLL